MTNERKDQKTPGNQGGLKTPTDNWNKDSTKKDQNQEDWNKNKTSTEEEEGTNQINQSNKNQEVDYPDRKEKGIDPMHRPYIVGDDEDADNNKNN